VCSHARVVHAFRIIVSQAEMAGARRRAIGNAAGSFGSIAIVAERVPAISALASDKSQRVPG